MYLGCVFNLNWKTEHTLMHILCKNKCASVQLYIHYNLTNDGVDDKKVVCSVKNCMTAHLDRHHSRCADSERKLDIKTNASCSTSRNDCMSAPAQVEELIPQQSGVIHLDIITFDRGIPPECNGQWQNWTHKHYESNYCQSAKSR